jgi:uncharacterized protein YukE
MAQMLGMDVEQVRAFASFVDQKANDIDGIISSISSKLSQTQWVGNDRQKFESDWNGQLTTALKNVAQALRDTKDRANNNALEQEQASS